MNAQYITSFLAEKDNEQPRKNTDDEQSKLCITVRCFAKGKADHKRRRNARV